MQRGLFLQTCFFLSTVVGNVYQTLNVAAFTMVFTMKSMRTSTPMSTVSCIVFVWFTTECNVPTTCPNGTIQDGWRACYASQPLKDLRNFDGHNFDFNMGNCSYVLSQVCDKENSHPIVIIQLGPLYLEWVYGVNMLLEMEHLGKVKVSSGTFTNNLLSVP